MGGKLHDLMTGIGDRTRSNSPNNQYIDWCVESGELDMQKLDDGFKPATSPRKGMANDYRPKITNDQLDEMIKNSKSPTELLTGFIEEESQYDYTYAISAYIRENNKNHLRLDICKRAIGNPEGHSVVDTIYGEEKKVIEYKLITERLAAQ